MATATIELAGDRLLNCREAAAVLTVKPRTLDVWRSLRKGPKFIRVGGAIRYKLADLRAYLDSRVVPIPQQPAAGDGGEV